MKSFYKFLEALNVAAGNAGTQSNQQFSGMVQQPQQQPQQQNYNDVISQYVTKIIKPMLQKNGVDNMFADSQLIQFAQQAKSISREAGKRDEYLNKVVQSAKYIKSQQDKLVQQVNPDQQAKQGQGQMNNNRISQNNSNNYSNN